MAAQVHIDPRVVRHLRLLSESGDDLARRLIEAWIAEGARDLDQLQHAVDVGDLKAVRRLAKVSKRSADNLGATGLASSLVKLGELAASRRVSTADLEIAVHACWGAFDASSQTLQALVEDEGTQPTVPRVDEA